jgi:hypothetical protein
MRWCMAMMLMPWLRHRLQHRLQIIFMHREVVIDNRIFIVAGEPRPGIDTHLVADFEAVHPGSAPDSADDALDRRSSDMLVAGMSPSKSLDGWTRSDEPSELARCGRKGVPLTRRQQFLGEAAAPAIGHGIGVARPSFRQPRYRVVCHAAWTTTPCSAAPTESRRQRSSGCPSARRRIRAAAEQARS